MVHPRKRVVHELFGVVGTSPCIDRIGFGVPFSACGRALGVVRTALNDGCTPTHCLANEASDRRELRHLVRIRDHERCSPGEETEARASKLEPGANVLARA